MRDVTPVDGRTLDVGCGSALAAVWLSLRSTSAEGLDQSGRIVERARHVNLLLGGRAAFRQADAFRLYEKGAQRYNTIHHEGLLEFCNLAQVRALLAQQVALADTVVFSARSAYYPRPEEHNGQFLLTIENWQEILSPFDVAELRYYGLPQNGGREHILCVLRGQAFSAPLRALMEGHKRPRPTGVTGLVLACNEADKLARCLERLKWCDELIAVVMDSGVAGDRTAEVAAQHATRVLTHPKVNPWDWARGMGILFSRYSHTVVVDADELVPPALGEILRSIAKSGDTSFAAMRLPMNHVFCGRVLHGLSPGFTSPRFFHTDRVMYNAQLHSGAQVDGPLVNLPIEGPDLAILHESYPTYVSYEEKQSRYTSTEAEALFRSGVRYDWRTALMHALHDFRSYFENGKGGPDGPLWLHYALEGAVYRMREFGKLYALRDRAGLLESQERAAPQSTREVVELVLGALNQPPRPVEAPIVVSRAPGAASVLYAGPHNHYSGLGEESRNNALAAYGAGVDLAVQIMPWGPEASPASQADREAIDAMAARPVRPGFTQIVEGFPQDWRRHPEAGRLIVRTMCESDRFCDAWAEAANAADELWAPAAASRDALVASGVPAAKIRIVPGAFDFGPCLAAYEPTALTERIKATGRFTFLAVFDWNAHKGHRELLSAFCRLAQDVQDVQLVLRVWSSTGMTEADILAEAAEQVKADTGVDLANEDRVLFQFERLSRGELMSLYKAV